MSAHTPGPWTLDPRGGGVVRGSKVYQYARGAGQRQLALACLHDDLGPEEREANARLIAAAPDLLEACEAVLKRLEGHSQLSDAEFDALESAVTKARGGK